MKAIRLCDICDFQGGAQPPKNQWIDERREGYVRMLQIRDFTQIEKVKPEFVKISARVKMCKEDDILIARYGASVGKILTGLSGAYNVAIMKTIPDEKKISKKYLFYFLSSEYFQKFIMNVGSRAAQAGFNKDDLQNVMLIERTLEEQQVTCKVLDKITELITNRKTELRLLDKCVKSRFVELFGDININDKGWESYPLGELCTIVRGGSPRPIESYLGGDVPWIKIGDATDGESIYLHSTREHIIQDGVKKSRLVKAGSLIFANCGVSLGFARIITFDGCIHDGWLAMEDIDTRLDKVFLLQTLNQMTEHFRKIAPAGTQPNLNTAIVKAYMQIVPPMELQQEFISFVQQVDKSKYCSQKFEELCHELIKIYEQEWM